MSINYKHYTYRVTWSSEDDEYVGLCAEFPSLSWLEKEQEAALTGICQLVQDVVQDMLINGEENLIPKPLSERYYSGQFKVRIPSDVHRTLVLQAAEQNISLNRLVSVKLAS